MSTTSRIEIIKMDGTKKSIYCHYDGDVIHNGIILQKYYSSAEKLEKLIELGDIVSLRPTIESTNAYHRDEGEKLEFTNEPQEINYSFNERSGIWMVEENSFEEIYSPILGMITVIASSEKSYLIEYIKEIFDSLDCSSDDEELLSGICRKYDINNYEEIEEIAKNSVKCHKYVNDIF